MQQRRGRPVSDKTNAVREHLEQHRSTVQEVAHATQLSISDAGKAVYRLAEWGQVYKVGEVPTSRRPAGIFAARMAPPLQPADLSAALLSDVIRRWGGKGGA